MSKEKQNRLRQTLIGDNFSFTICNSIFDLKKNEAKKSSLHLVEKILFDFFSKRQHIKHIDFLIYIFGEPHSINVVLDNNSMVRLYVNYYNRPKILKRTYTGKKIRKNHPVYEVVDFLNLFFNSFTINNIYEIFGSKFRFSKTGYTNIENE